MSKETFVTYKCPKCNFKEDIPKEVVDYFDLTDLGDPTVPPRFDCQKCDGKMEPTYYVNREGFIYNS